LNENAVRPKAVSALMFQILPSASRQGRL
jgi:hypothetical protein